MAIPAEPATPSASYKMITIPEAQQLVLHHAEQLQAEHVSLSASLGRILSEDVVAAEPLPPCEVSFKVNGTFNKTSSDMAIHIATTNQCNVHPRNTMFTNQRARFALGHAESPIDQRIRNEHICHCTSTCMSRYAV
jgi:hypothetical protein